MLAPGAQKLIGASKVGDVALITRVDSGRGQGNEFADQRAGRELACAACLSTSLKRINTRCEQPANYHADQPKDRFRHERRLRDRVEPDQHRVALTVLAGCPISRDGRTRGER